MPSPPRVADPQVTPPLVIAIYLRLSRKTRESVSLEAQEAQCREYVSRMGWSGDIRVYADRKTASDRAKVRPGYEALLADVKARKVHVIVCRDDDRLVRQPIELERLIDVLDPAGVPVYFYVSGVLDLSSSPGRANARIRGAIARQEVERKSERQKESNRHRISQGAPTGGPPPFGFIYVAPANGKPSTYRQVPEEADGIRWAYDFIRKGGSLSDVQREWNHRGLVTRKTGKPHTWQGVKAALLNPAVAGLLAYQPHSILNGEGRTSESGWVHQRYKADLTEGNWEGILQPDEWRDMVAILTRTKSQWGNKVKWLLSGMLICGICDGDQPLYCRAYRDNRHPRIYLCHNVYHGAIAAEPVEAYVSRLVVEMMAAGELRDETAEAQTASDREVLVKELADLEAELTELTNAYVRRAIRLNQLEAGTSAINGRIDGINEKLRTPGGHGVHVGADHLDPEEFEALTVQQKRLYIGDALPQIRAFQPDKATEVHPATYIHAYDRRGRLRPLALDDDDYWGITVEQYRTAERHGKPIVIDGVAMTYDAAGKAAYEAARAVRWAEMTASLPTIVSP